MSDIDEQRVLRQFDKAVALAHADNVELDWGRSIGLGVFARNTRLFLRGDLVLVWFSNGGGERWHVYGYSSRGYSVSNRYVQGYRYRDRGVWRPAGKNGTYEYKASRTSSQDVHSNKTPMRVVDVPDEVSNGLKSDPARLRRWLSEALRTGYAARGVGSGSPALFLPFVHQDTPPRARRKQWLGP